VGNGQKAFGSSGMEAMSQHRLDHQPHLDYGRRELSDSASKTAQAVSRYVREGFSDLFDFGICEDGFI